MDAYAMSPTFSHPVTLAHHPYAQEGMEVAQKVVRALQQRSLAPAFRWFVLTETPQGMIWLLAILDKHRIAKMEPYIHPQTLHQIRTMVDGRPTLLSNTTGLRYAILLAGQRVLPASIPFPNDLPQERYPLGETFDGPLVVSWQSIRNVLVTGVQGAGKSAFLLGAANLALRQGAVLYLADPELHTFNPDLWNRYAALPVAADEAGFQGLLQHLSQEIERRSALFRTMAAGERPPENLVAYNQLAANQGLPTLPRLLLVADEANDFFDDKKLTQKITELARHGRKWGVNLIMAAHSWRAEDVPRGLSARFPTRISFRVEDDTSATVVLGDPHLGRQAMQLSHPGQGLIKLEGKPVQTFQAYYLSPEQEAAWLKPLTPGAPQNVPLSPRDQTLAELVCGPFEGWFLVRELAEKAQMGRNTINDLAQVWEDLGYLTEVQRNAQGHVLGRRATEKLYQIAGIPGSGGSEGSAGFGRDRGGIRL